MTYVLSELLHSYDVLLVGLGDAVLVAVAHLLVEWCSRDGSGLSR